ncbi:MAG: efflux RND transporter periplasmic adaptor subunit [Planctomycetota bacterium]
MKHSDSSTLELGQTRLALRDGLKFQLQDSKHETWYLIEDSLRGVFYRVGEAEYALLSELDGNSTLATVIAKTCSKLGVEALSEREAIQVAQWLLESGLASTRQSSNLETLREEKSSDLKKSLMQRVNPICVKVHLGNPDSFFEMLARYLGALVSLPAALLWVVVCAFGLLQFLDHWEQFRSYSEVFFTRDGFLYLAGTWLILKLVHEYAHGIACKKFGGAVRGFGIMFFLMIPLPFVDVTSSWRLSSKYQKMLVAGAGMLAELFLAAVAALIWVHSEPGLVQMIAANIVIAASLHTLIFNANPLMRFDGYHMLADWLEIPNLGNHGAAYVRNLGARIFFGVPPQLQQYSGLHGHAVKLYGLAAMVWKLMLCATLTIAAANTMQGLGLLLAASAIIVWVATPLFSFVRGYFLDKDANGGSRIRFFMVSGSLAAGLAGVMSLPAPTVVQAPFVVDFHDLETIRVSTAGFIEEIYVQDGQEVREGDRLFNLVSPHLASEIQAMRQELEQAKIRKRVQENVGEIGLAQLEHETIAELLSKLSELELSMEQLQIYAPRSGRVLATDLSQLLQTYVKVGQELCEIGDGNDLEVTALVSAHDSSEVSELLERPVTLLVWGQPDRREGFVTEVSPESLDVLPHFAFAGTYGGPLDVLDRGRVDGSSQDSAASRLQHEDRLGNLKLVSPRVKLRVSLFEEATNGDFYKAGNSQDVSSPLLAGQTGILQLRQRDISMGDFLLGQTQQWIRSHLNRTHGL